MPQIGKPKTPPIRVGKPTKGKKRMPPPGTAYPHKDPAMKKSTRPKTHPAAAIRVANAAEIRMSLTIRI